MAVTLIFFVFMLPRSPRFGYEYKKGEYWMYETLVAEYDFPILKTADQLQSEKDSVKAAKMPYFDRIDSVEESVKESLAEVSVASAAAAVEMLQDSILTQI